MMFQRLLPLVLIALAASSPGQAQSVETPQQDAAASQVEDILVQGLRNDQIAQQFASTVGAPATGRKLAVWRMPICVGTVGMRGEPARAMIDRVSDWGYSLGLRIGAPGCRPNILIVTAENGDEAARSMAVTHRRVFRTGTSGTTAGAAALRAFQTSGRPIRWWHTSMPINTDTGKPAVRVRGEDPFGAREIRTPADLGPYGVIVQPSRLRDETQDDLRQALIILENSALDQADFMQVADYVAMVALAQISADTSPPTASILHLFDAAKAPSETLTAWDQAYLQALYASDQSKASQGANEATIASAMVRIVERDNAASQAD
ncbi:MULTISPECIES: hypothetical protein [unclassified Brevundimonas]|uniref:hypothetical protein n=1 Tax=unclassified Brevundimonas TaxID=2622653 RepID=UPI0025B83475|nr:MULTISPECIES: hypothetical protein [unclassified Brevundimonas]